MRVRPIKDVDSEEEEDYEDEWGYKENGVYYYNKPCEMVLCNEDAMRGEDYCKEHLEEVFFGSEGAS